MAGPCSNEIARQTGIEHSRMSAEKIKKTYSTGAFFFIAPAVVVLLAVGIFPLLFAVGVSFHQFLLPKVHWHGNFLGGANLRCPVRLVRKLHLNFSGRLVSRVS